MRAKSIDPSHIGIYALLILFAVTTLQKPELQPITVALRNLSGSQIKEWNVVMAGALIAHVPTLIIYILLGRYFIRGLLAGSVKG